MKRTKYYKCNCAPDVLNIGECLPKLASWPTCLAVNNQKRKTHAFEVDHSARDARRSKLHTVKHRYILQKPTGEKIERKRVYETTPADAEARQITLEAAQSFISTIEFYKSESGGGKPHDEAVTETLKLQEWRRGYVEGLLPAEVEWGHITAVAEVNTDDALKLWARVREAADDELESGKRGAKVAGDNTTPYALAQYLAIRDSFADQWQPQGGLESAMIDMLTIAFSLQMYWAGIAHDRAMRIHDEQREQLKRYESSGWKSPCQSEADGIDQAHRLADGYNRQFLRVLRQLRDLRRYTPPVIVNQPGGQVNVANQQVNVSSK